MLDLNYRSAFFVARAALAIGDLYTKGNGVRADQVQAQNWHARAQSCQGGNIAILQKQVAQFKARAAAARDPALYPVLAALPDNTRPSAQGPRTSDNPRSSAQTRNPDHSGFDQSILVGLVAGAVIAAAIIAPTPSSGTGNSDSVGPFDAINRNFQMDEARRNCVQGGGTPFGNSWGWRSGRFPRYERCRGLRAAVLYFLTSPNSWMRETSMVCACR
jgi:hypothetical protein